jgi:RNA polymerase sigma-70 factor (ECF subfamily)
MTASTLQRDVVAAAVESLRPEHRQILAETYFKGRSVTDAAQALDLPVRVVKVRVYDAMRELRRILPVEPAGRGPLATRLSAPV